MQTNRIALVGDFSPQVTAHRAINESLRLASEVAASEGAWLHTATIKRGQPLDGFHGIWCVPGSPYAIVPSAATGGSFNAANYTISYATGTLTVNKAPLTVTINSTSKIYGDTTNFTAKTRFRQSGEGLHVIERFTPESSTMIRYDFTVEDPATYLQPWSGSVWITRTADRLYEYACHEANYSMVGILKGARAGERERTK
jgi:hypothetical protein